MFNSLKKYFITRNSQALVLMYHRVCNLSTDPWQLAVSPEHFDEQIEMVTKNFEVQSVNELIPQLAVKTIQHRSLYISFDDGYADNYLNAVPILEKYKCPATFFIPTYFTGKGQPFWWDKLVTIFLHSDALPSHLELPVGKQAYPFTTVVEPLTDDLRQKQQSWKWPQTPPTKRCSLYLAIWEILKPLPYLQISDAIHYLEKWSGCTSDVSDEDVAMNNEQLKALSNNSLFSLGLHSHTHIALAAHTQAIQEQEITGNMDEFNKNGNSRINAIAYPYGNNNADTHSILKEQAIDLGFTTQVMTITKQSSPYTLGRFQVSNCDGATLKRQIEDLFSS